MIHGGDWARFEQEYGCVPLDFSANVSPLGMPDGVRRAVIQSLDTVPRYPDPLCRVLRENLGQFHGLSETKILCGAGAADLIFRLVLAHKPQQALVTAPTFTEYAQALKLVGCKIQQYALSAQNGFIVTEDILSHITPELDLLFLCEPNNPTGRTTPPILLQQILQRCKDCGVLLAVDECFNDFLEDPASHTLQGALENSDNLVIFRAFTKSYALAGLRLGYALCCDAVLAERMRAAGPPWAVSTPAQAAGVAALQDLEYLQTLRKLIAEQRPQMQMALTAMECQVCPGEANYLLFYYPDVQLAQKLRKRGILLRDCSNYAGLGPGWYRTAVRTAEENEILLQAMKEVR